MGISLIEVALGRFPFSDSNDDDDEDQFDFDINATLSPPSNSRHSLLAVSSRGGGDDETVHPGRPASMQPMPRPPQRTAEQKAKEKADRRNSRGVSLEGGAMMMSILELLQHIVNEPAPRLVPEDKFPKDSQDFIDLCLRKEPDQRPTPKELLVSGPSPNPHDCDRAEPLFRQAHPWMLHAISSNQVNLEAWAAAL